jgi:hypothetical protein
MIAAYTFVRLMEIPFKKYETGGTLLTILAVIGLLVVVTSWLAMIFSGAGSPVTGF